MPSSISNSKRRVLLLVISLALLVAFTEIAGSLGLSHISRIQKRIDMEGAEAQQLTKTGLNGRPTLLLVGNSLIMEAADFPKMKEATAVKYDIHRYVIEQTSYFDWYFALKHLFRHGSRPSVVVLSLSVGQFLTDGSRGEFMAHTATDVQDLPELMHREHLDYTSASNMLFAHYSGWLGARSEIRKWLLGKLMPNAASVANVLGFQKAPPFSPELLNEKLDRLREMKAICDANGAQFILLLPPMVSEDGSALLVSTAAQLGVKVIDPVKPGEFSKDFFRDGFHLTDQGAQLFTPKLVEAFLNY